MSEAITDRLRRGASPLDDPDLNDEAADEIERLRDTLKLQSAAHHGEVQEQTAADTALLRQALDALESCDSAHPSDGGRQWYDDKTVEAAIAALRERLGDGNGA